MLLERDVLGALFFVAGFGRKKATIFVAGWGPKYYFVMDTFTLPV